MENAFSTNCKLSYIAGTGVSLQEILPCHGDFHGCQLVRHSICDKIISTTKALTQHTTPTLQSWLMKRGERLERLTRHSSGCGAPLVFYLTIEKKTNTQAYDKVQKCGVVMAAPATRTRAQGSHLPRHDGSRLGMHHHQHEIYLVLLDLSA